MNLKIQHIDSISFWNAIDIIAARQKMSLMKVATIAGLDPTSLSHSKRTLANGKARWISTSTLTKVLQATNVSLSEFVAVVEQSDLKNYLFAIAVIARRKNMSLNHIEKMSELPKGFLSSEAIITKTNQIQTLSTNVLTKVLQVLNVSLIEFVAVVEDNDKQKSKNTIPLYTWNRILQCSSLSEIKPPVQNLQLSESIKLESKNKFAIEGPNLSPWQPIFCTNRFLIINVYESIEESDLIIIRMRAEKLFLGTFLRRTTMRVELQHNQDKYDSLELDSREVSWMARVSGILMEPFVKIIK